jgi:hypothetical protein
MTFVPVTVLALAVTGWALAAPAAAAPLGGSNAADTVAALQSKGFTVQLNGSAAVPLSECTATDVHGLNNSNVDAAGDIIDTGRLTKVFVDVSCPSHD